MLALGQIGLRVGADGFEQQLGDRLLDLGALDLEQRGFRARTAALRGGDHAHDGRIQRHQLDLDRGQPLHEAGILDQRAAFVVHFLRGQCLQLAQLVARAADAGNAGVVLPWGQGRGGVSTVV